MKTKELQALWWDWLSTSERLTRSLYEQTAALTLRDVAKIERLQPELDGMLSRMQEIDEQAILVAKGLAEEAGADPNLRSLVTTLDKAEAEQVQSLANRITVVARNVQQLIDKNRALMENELTYINGTLALVAKVAQENQGVYQPSAKATVLMDQVA